MTPDALFTHAGNVAVAGWLVLLLGPRRWPLLNAVPAFAIPLALSALYTVLVLRHFAAAGGGYDSLAAVATLLSGPWMLLAGWVHFLAFDLFAGAWLARRMDAVGLHRLLQAPVLVSVLMFGPAGLLLGLLAVGSLRLPFPPFAARHERIRDGLA